MSKSANIPITPNVLKPTSVAQCTLCRYHQPVRSAYIGRLAPSPTGLLHLGHAATFRAAFTRAREHNGILLLRNEDLDPQRSRPEFVAAILEDLSWLGIAWQPPLLSQSGRLPTYRAAFERLLAAGNIYPCTCSRRDLAHIAQAPHEDDSDDEPRYDGHCRPSGCPKPALSEAEGADLSDVGLSPSPVNLQANYRFRVPDGETIRFLDHSLGPRHFTAGADFSDFVIWRRPLTGDPTDLGLPSYQLACVIDDAHQRITEVVRGADLLKSTARQILLQRALGLPRVDYFHTALLRDEHGVRLAKRHDALAIQTLRNAGLTATDVLARIAAK